MTTCATTPTFSPIPQRALCDDRLTLLDLRVLGAIASHDRFNANGQACWASNERLAAVLKCHPNSLTRVITRLIKFGYVKDLGTRPGKRRSRARFLTVIYTEADLEAFSVHPDPTEIPADEDELPEPRETTAPVEVNPGGLVEPNPVGLPKRRGRNCAEALGSSYKQMQPQRRAPPRPPDLSKPLVAIMEQRNRKRVQAALLLGNGNLTEGFKLLDRIPDARRPEHA